MKTIQVNFIPHILTEQELKQGQILNESQIRFIENQLTQAMSERANLTYDATTPITTFVQAEAALMGQIDAFSFLLSAHAEVISSLQEDHLS
jgi:hypothetical protein